MRNSSLDETGDRVGHRVWDVDAGVAKRDPGERRRPHHLFAGQVVTGDGIREMCAAESQRLATADVAPRIRTLTGRSRLGDRPLRERTRGERLDGVAQHVHSARGDDSRRQRARATRIDDGFGRTQSHRRDAGLGVEREPIEDRDARDLAAGPRGRRACEMGGERAGHGETIAERRVDMAAKLRRMRRVEVGRLGRIDDRAAADRDVAIDPGIAREPDRLVERCIGRLDRDGVEDADLDGRGAQRGFDLVEPVQTPHRGVRDKRRSTNTVRPRSFTDLTERAGAKRHARGIDGEGSLEPGFDRLEVRAGHAVMMPHRAARRRSNLTLRSGRHVGQARVQARPAQDLGRGADGEPGLRHQPRGPRARSPARSPRPRSSASRSRSWSAAATSSAASQSRRAAWIARPPTTSACSRP